MSHPAPVILGDDFIQDAHAVAASLRTTSPVRFVLLPGGFPVWLVSGYSEARLVMTDARFSSDRVYDRLARLRVGPDEEVSFSDDLVMNLLNLDPPDHTRLRRLVTKTFTRRAVEPLRPRIAAIAADLLTAMQGRDVVDLVSEYAAPLPIRVICELLGVPFEDRDDFTGWTRRMVAATNQEEIGAASTELAAYLGVLVDAKRQSPSDDLLSELVQAVDDGDRLSRRELIATASLLLTGGFETTVNLIGSGMDALLRNPDQLALLRTDRSLLPNAIEEFLRYETPNNLSSPRFTTEDVELGGALIPAGHFVMVSWLAVNRSGQFTDPDRLDVTRPAGGHLAFGHGMHHCVGAALARLEGEIAFGALLDRFPQLELVSGDKPARWLHSTAMHGLESLVVRTGEPRR
ncbi:cytochrome P450 [Kribbella sp. NPDC056861]|uniref:cytochrome P450 family protein n=1 Tax=Kribbella sp. NPDC056861 TaxID=3154857 RepID=UPI00342D8601